MSSQPQVPGQIADPCRHQQARAPTRVPGSSSLRFAGPGLVPNLDQVMAMRSRSAIVTLAVAGALSLAACGGSSRSGTGSQPTTTTGSSATSAATGGQHLTVAPSLGLKSPATVQVTATGFSPGASLVVTQCANKGNGTGPADCNLAGIRTVTANSAGQISTQMTVIKGPFGAHHIVCSTSQSCLVSVSPATLSPTQEADAPITFA